VQFEDLPAGTAGVSPAGHDSGAFVSQQARRLRSRVSLNSNP